MDNKAIVLSTLAYFDLFHYPVTAGEIRFFLPHPLSVSELDRTLEELLKGGHVYMWEGFYTIHNDQALVYRRKKGNLLAADMLQTAEKVGAILSRFPYIRGVGVSGSLSKHYADEGSDIDLFIITAKNRLWIARTFLHLLKKLAFVIRKEDWFCMNYFVDELALEIPEKNMYTAIEIVTLIPLQGIKTFAAFSEANRWTNQLLPCSGRKPVLPEQDHSGSDAPHGAPAALRAPFLKRALESLFNNAFGDRLERWLMRLTAGRWSRKTQAGKKNNRGVVMSLSASQHTARPEPGDFQKGLLLAYERKVKEVLTNLGVREDVEQLSHQKK